MKVDRVFNTEKKCKSFKKKVNINIDYFPYIFQLNYNLIKNYGTTTRTKFTIG